MGEGCGKAGLLGAGEEDRTPMQTLPRRYPGRSPSLETRFPTGPLLVCSVLLQPCGRGFLQSARVTGRRCLRFRRASPFRPHPLDTHLGSTSCATQTGLQTQGDSVTGLLRAYPAGYRERDAYRVGEEPQKAQRAQKPEAEDDGEELTGGEAASEPGRGESRTSGRADPRGAGIEGRPA